MMIYFSKDQQRMEEEQFSEGDYFFNLLAESNFGQKVSERISFEEKDSSVLEIEKEVVQNGGQFLEEQKKGVEEPQEKGQMFQKFDQIIDSLINVINTITELKKN